MERSNGRSIARGRVDVLRKSSVTSLALAVKGGGGNETKSESGNEMTFGPLTP
jgi:hypothetical protein